MRRNIVDRTGLRYGKLVVLRLITSGVEYDRIRSYSTSAIWLCKCDCGVEKVINGERLQKGAKSCGCSNGPINEVGNRYGRLTVKERCKPFTGHALWLCECDCGVEIRVRGTALRYGCSLSCGCWREDAASIACSNTKPIYLIDDSLVQTRIRSRYRRGVASVPRQYSKNMETT